MSYNPLKANKGRGLEETVKLQNELYQKRGYANIQKISTPWKVIRRGKDIVSAFPGEKSTLDFRGTVYGGISMSFDTKESEDERGLPLKYIAQHQIDYIRQALPLGEVSFILCEVKPRHAYYVIPGRTAQMCLAAAMEIGRLLCEAKAQVAYGAWGDWLENNVAYSQSQANNLMRLYQNYGEQEQLDFFEENRMDIFGSLSPSQAVALLGLPADQRREFVETHDMEQTSVRDIEQEIRARKEAEEKLAAAEEKAENATRLAEEERERADEAVSQLEEERDRADEAVSRLEEEREDLRHELEQLKATAEPVAVQATVEPDPAAIRAAEKELKDKLQKQFDKKLEKEKAALQKQVDEAKKSAEDAAQEKAASEQRIRQEMEAAYSEQLAQLRREKESVEAKLATADNVAVQKFSLHFENLQREFDALMELLLAIRQDDAATAEKLAAAMARITSEMCSEFERSGEE